MIDNFERFFVLTNPIYWIAYAVFTPIGWLARWFVRLKNYYSNYIFLKYRMQNCTNDHLRIIVINIRQREFFGLKINRAIKLKAIQILRSRGEKVY